MTKPPAEHPAATLKVPGVVFSAPDDPAVAAVQCRRAWPGSGTARCCGWSARPKPRAWPKAAGWRSSSACGGSDRRTQKTVRALLTGYLLYTLTGDKTYKEFADPEAVLPKTDELDPDARRWLPRKRSSRC